MPKPQSRTPVLPLVWIGICVYCNCAGWILSAVHQLNFAGYLVTFCVGAAVLWCFRDTLPTRSDWAHAVRWPAGRFRRLFPLGFLALAGIAFLGGALHAPNNYDALAYRTPRVLHWLAEQQWHWIHTDFGRLNNRSAGIEWLTAPLFLLTKSDRGVFLLNIVSLLLLPGRVFSLLIRLGVSRRASWYWMWLIPTGYCYLIQAGSIANDLFGAIISLVALEFALRARDSGKPMELWVSILAAAFMTACKVFNLLLLLPWFVAIVPALRLLLLRPLLLAIVLAASLVTSMVPTAILNQYYCGDWKGLAAEQSHPLLAGSPPFRLAFNVPIMILNNFTPPVFPLAGAWNRLMERTIPPSLSAKLRDNFEPGAARLRIDEIQIEEQAGLGFGLSVLLVIMLICRVRYRKPGPWKMPAVSHLLRREIIVPISMYLSAIIFMAEAGLNCPGRYFAPYYPVLVVPILTGSEQFLDTMRRAWFRMAAVCVFLLAALALVILPARPLWPAKTILRSLGAANSTNPLLKRVWSVYSVYATRADGYAPLRAQLPADANPLGVYMFDYPEGALWKPFGSRRICHVTSSDSAEDMKGAGIRYVLICGRDFDLHYPGGTTIDSWLKKYNAELVLKMPLELRASAGPNDWYLVKLR